jgi:hypothetical protein
VEWALIARSFKEGGLWRRINQSTAYKTRKKSSYRFTTTYRQKIISTKLIGTLVKSW